MKRCTRCGETKPLEDFPKRARKYARDGRYSYCRPCDRAFAAERQRKWRAADPERARRVATKNSQRFRTANPDYHREWYARHLEAERERSRLVMRKFRKQHPERAREQKQRYRQANLEAVRQRELENTHRRRALMGSASPELAAHMARLLQEPCDYCGATDNMTVDHVVPLSRGGKHEANNLVPACVSCNCSKGAKTLEEWLRPSPV